MVKVPSTRKVQSRRKVPKIENYISSKYAKPTRIDQSTKIEDNHKKITTVKKYQNRRKLESEYKKMNQTSFIFTL